MLDFSRLPGVSRNTLGALANFFSIAVVTTDAAGRGVTTNSQWDAWTGQAGTGAAADWRRAFDEQDQRTIEQCLDAARVKGSTCSQCRLTRKGGSGLPVRLTIFRIDDASGRIEGFVIGASDMSELDDMATRFHRAALSTIEALSAMEAVRDLHTAGHQAGVGRLAEAIGGELGLGAASLEGLRIAAVLHDVGKIGTPLGILTKPADLTYGEYAVVREHAANGFEILKGVTAEWPLARVAHEHHERLDGSGYPQGLRGDQILLEARITAVADVVESIAVNRPYRHALGMAAALEEIHRNRGRLYDPDAVNACVKVVEEHRFELRI